MIDKRHLVLYAVIALVLGGGVVFAAARHSGSVSYTTDVPLEATSTPAQAAATTTDSSGATITVAQTPKPRFRLEVVNDLKTQERGLGGRASIPENYGMLFVFPKKIPVGFWMKDMLTSIDIVWLADDGTVLGIEDSVSPTTYRSDKDADVLYPPQPVRYVLETRAGEMRRQGWSVGSRVPFALP